MTEFFTKPLKQGKVYSAHEHLDVVSVVDRTQCGACAGTVGQGSHLTPGVRPKDTLPPKSAQDPESHGSER